MKAVQKSSSGCKDMGTLETLRQEKMLRVTPLAYLHGQGLCCLKYCAIKQRSRWSQQPKLHPR